MKLSVCIDMMFSYCDFYDRIKEVKKCGIDTIEFWKWSNKDIDKLAESGIDISIFNMDSCDEKLSYDLSHGIMNDGRAEEFVSALRESIPVYKKLTAKAMIVLIGEGKPLGIRVILEFIVHPEPVRRVEVKPYNI